MSVDSFAEEEEKLYSIDGYSTIKTVNFKTGLTQSASSLRGRYIRELSASARGAFSRSVREVARIPGLRPPADGI